MLGRGTGIGGAARRAVLLAGLALASACAPIYRNHGYVPTEQDLALLQVGVDTRETVAEQVGRPSSSGVLSNSGWYYVQTRTKQVAYREPEQVDRQVLAISFAENGVLENIERFTLEDGRVIALSRRVTESNIKGVTFLGQLLGNLGNFRLSDDDLN